MPVQSPVRQIQIGPPHSYPIFADALAGGGGGGGISIPDVPVDNAGDDGDVNGGFDNAANEIEMGNTGTPKKGFFLFRNTGIPQGVSIVSASLTITSSANLNGTTVNLIINAADEDNPGQPADKTDVNDRPRTSREVAWNNVAAWTANTEYDSPDISPVIQELVDRPGFASDNVMIFLEDNGSTTNASRKGHSYNGDPAKAAVLHVSYTAVAWSPGDFTLYTGAHGAEPAAERNDLYLVNDGAWLERYSGARWMPYGGFLPFTAPVPGDFAWINQGTATLDTTYGGMYLYAPFAGQNTRMLKQSAPATPYTITAAIRPSVGGNNYSGVCWRQSSDGKEILFYIGRSLSIYRLYLTKFTNPTTYNSDYTNAYLNIDAALIYLRLEDDGTNRKCHWSLDGQHFHQFYSVGRTDFLTADEVGFFADCNQAAGGDAATHLLSWEVG